jgi:hypothetical protein
MDLINDVKVTNKITISDSSDSTATLACSITNLNTEVYYGIFELIENGTILYTDEQLTIPFQGDDGFYKIVEADKAAQINVTGGISNLTDC